MYTERKKYTLTKDQNMKISEMNAQQKKAFYNIRNAADYLIGGLENTMEDYPENSEEYQAAQSTLEDHDFLVNQIYDLALTEIFMEGANIFGRAAEAYLKDIRFCGKEWLMERVEKQVIKAGY